jgi:D-alanine-D-alanine ligase
MHLTFLHDRIPPGARPDELDALVQAEAVRAVVEPRGWRCSRLPVTLDLAAAAKALTADRPDLVFNLVESIEGHGRLLHLAPALLDALHISYTGSSAEALMLTTSKLLTKKLLAQAGIATPRWEVASCKLRVASEEGAGSPTPHSPLATRNSPLATFIIKSVWEEASVGLTDDSIVAVRDEAELRRMITDRAGSLGGEAFAEQYIDGREFNLSLLARPGGGCDVLPPAEIRFVDYPADKPKFVGYAAKWDAESFEFRSTPRTFDFPPADDALLADLRRIAVRCWEAFDLRGYVRVDFRVDADGRPWVLEINANPCLSPDAGFAAAADRAGLAFETVVDRIIGDALRP